MQPCSLLDFSHKTQLLSLLTAATTLADAHTCALSHTRTLGWSNSCYILTQLISCYSVLSNRHQLPPIHHSRLQSSSIQMSTFTCETRGLSDFSEEGIWLSTSIPFNHICSHFIRRLPGHKVTLSRRLSKGTTGHVQTNSTGTKQIVSYNLTVP